MIPPFNELGCLPPGAHPATLDEIDARFGRLSELRRVQMDSLRWMVDLAVRAGVERVVLNGSFVTDIMEPNDVDCVPASRARISDRPGRGGGAGNRAAVSGHRHRRTDRL